MIKKDIEETTIYRKAGDVGLLEYKALNVFDGIVNAFSTREGGVSEGQYATMNFSVTMGDDPERVAENFRIFGHAIGVDPQDMVYADQKHTDHVMVVGSEHKGMGVTRPRGFEAVDGLVTNERGVCLVTSYADCVPLYFYDPVHNAIGLTHSGWRGTVAKIAAKTIGLMHETYGTAAGDLICCIGPCIGKECYEVSEDVAKEFSAAYTKEQYERICEPREEAGTYLLDLPQANREQFIECGVPSGNIRMPDLCTACNSGLLHSHRATGGKRGGNCAFLMIKK